MAVTANISMLLRYGLTVIGGIAILFYTLVATDGGDAQHRASGRAGAVIYGRMLRALAKQVAGRAGPRHRRWQKRRFPAFAPCAPSPAKSGQEIGRYGTAVEASLSLARKRSRLGRSSLAWSALPAMAPSQRCVNGGTPWSCAATCGSATLTAFILYTPCWWFAFGAVSDLWADFMRAAISENVFELLPPAEAASRKTRLQRVGGGVAFNEVDFAPIPPVPMSACCSGSAFRCAPARWWPWLAPRAPANRRWPLLSRFYDPVSGTVQLDGTDLRSLDSDWLREQVGVVSRRADPVCGVDPRKYPLRPPHRDRRRIEAAARAANATTLSAASRRLRHPGRRARRPPVGRPEATCRHRSCPAERPASLVLDERPAPSMPRRGPWCKRLSTA